MPKGIRRSNNYTAPQRNQRNATLEVTQELRFQTHLLPPQLLKEYNEIIPGFAKDIHQEFINEATNRRSNNNWLVKGMIISRFLGQVLGFGIAVFVLYIAWDLGVKGHDWLAGTIAVIDLAALVSVFIGVQHYGEKREKVRQENEQITEQSSGQLSAAEEDSD